MAKGMRMSHVRPILKAKNSHIQKKQNQGAAKNLIYFEEDLEKELNQKVHVI